MDMVMGYTLMLFLLIFVTLACECTFCEFLRFKAYVRDGT